MTHQRSAAQHRRRYEGDEPEAVRIRLLGGFGVSVGSRVVEGDRWRLRKAGSLVKLLALAPRHALHREQLMAVLWPDLDPKSASNNLHRVLHFARRALEPDAANTAFRYLLLQGEMLALCPDGQLWVDVEAFESAAINARRGRAPAAYWAAVELYAGDLLPEDRYEAWAEERRGELRLLYHALLIELAGLHEEIGDRAAAIGTLQKAVSEEPAHEEAHLGLMRLYATNGQRRQALLQYQRLREALATELEKEPDVVGGERLYEEILAGRFPRVPSRPDRHSLETLRGAAGEHNLPNSPSSFVGREREMVEIKRSLAMTQLLTLTGAGGSGKTRLALEVARDLAGTYPDGVWLVEFAPLSDPGLVPQVAAGVLRVREQPDLSLSETLSDHLRSRQTLLVLDNCEHLIGACARLAHTLLGACPKLKVLATSREALDVPGEAVWPVLPLTVPEDSSSTPERLAGYEAVRLFVERARSKLPAFELTSANSRSVIEVCRKLDGIPLAIELAAARVTVLAVEQVAQRLADSLGLLTGGRTVEPRHRTMRAVLDWSHELLGEPERKLFRRLSIFAGGWTLEAAEAGGEGGGIPHGEVLNLLSKLVEKSLVVAEGGYEGTLRYRMLEPVRQYAREHLEESGEMAKARERHARHYLALAEQAEPELLGARPEPWLERLEIERDNLRAALSWALDTDARSEERAGMGLRLASALGRFWNAHDPAEGRRWLDKGLVKGDASSPSVRAKALNVAGFIAAYENDPRASDMLEEGFALYKELGDSSGMAVSIFNLGHAMAHFGRHERLATLRQETEELLRRPLDRAQIAHLLLFLVFVAASEENLEAEAARLSECLALFREVGDLRGVAMSLTCAGMAALQRRDHDRAAELFEEDLRLLQALRDKTGIFFGLLGMAGVSALLARADRAARLLGAAEALREALSLSLTPLITVRYDLEGYTAAAREALGEAAFDTAYSEGHAMPPERGVRYALGEEEPPPPATPEPQRDPDRAADSLTRREREVAFLAARGLTNRRIAGELSISEHTVANHLRNIRKKLGLRSRAQISSRL